MRSPWAAGRRSRALSVALRIVLDLRRHAAPGQIASRDAASTSTACTRQRQDTALYAIAGAPLGHSASPAMHNAAFAALGLDAVYVPLETADAAEFLRVAEALRRRGRQRHRAAQTGVRCAARRAPAIRRRVTRAIGALNTLRRGPARLGRAQLRRRRVPRAARAPRLSSCAASARWCSAPAAPRGRRPGRCRRAGRRVAIARGRPDEAARARGASSASRTTPWPPPPAGICWSTRRRSARGRPVDASPIAAGTTSRAGCVYDLVYNPPETTLLAGARGGGRRDDRRSRDAVAQACRSSSGGRAARAAGGDGARRARQFIQRSAGSEHEADDVRRVRGAVAARHVRAGVARDHGGPADAGLGVPEDRRALRLRVPARERRGRRARRPLLVPRQGSVPRPARPRRRRRRSSRPGVAHDARRAVHRRAARPDGGVPGAVRAGPAALHRRRRRLPRLRRRRVVRAGRAARASRCPIAIRPASWSSTRCSRSIT